MGLPIRVFQLIAALESLEEGAAIEDKRADDGVGRDALNHIQQVVEYLQDDSVFDPMDPIISFE